MATTRVQALSEGACRVGFVEGGLGVRAAVVIVADSGLLGRLYRHRSAVVRESMGIAVAGVGPESGRIDARGQLLEASRVGVADWAEAATVRYRVAVRVVVGSLAGWR